MIIIIVYIFSLALSHSFFLSPSHFLTQICVCMNEKPEGKRGTEQCDETDEAVCFSLLRIFQETVVLFYVY